MTPLGKILVAKSYNMRGNVEKTTKTDAVKHTLFVRAGRNAGAVEARWWPEMWTCAGPDDLIVLMPPDAAERRRS